MRVLHLDIDSLRPDHVGAYGYNNETTPNIDQVAADAVQFENAYAANSPCMPSRAAVMSGRYGTNNGVVTHGSDGRVLNSPHMWNGVEYDESWRTLPEQFFHERVRTAGISSFPRHPSPWFYHLWHEFYQPQEPKGDGEYFQTPRAEDVSDLAIQFVEDNLDDEFYLYVQYWDPHRPYNRSEQEIDEFRDPPLPPHPTESQIEEHLEWDTWRSAAKQGIESREDLAETLAHYDAEINYVDSHIGRLLETLRDHDRYDETLIVITADHGEEFGEHGLYHEHWSTYDGTQRIPLIIKPPADADCESGTREHLVTNVDLAPTIADYADIDQPEKWQGQSLRPIVSDATTDGRDHVVVDHGLYTAQRAVRTDRWKLVRTYNAGLWNDVLSEVELYDMQDDPWEQTDVSEDNPGVVDELQSTMIQWAEEHQGREEDALKRVAREGPAGLQWAQDD